MTAAQAQALADQFTGRTSFDAILDAMEAAGTPEGRIEANEGELIEADLARARAKSANNGWDWEQARADRAQRRAGR